jgi:hypothetical protein
VNTINAKNRDELMLIKEACYRTLVAKEEGGKKRFKISAVGIDKNA